MSELNVDFVGLVEPSGSISGRTQEKRETMTLNTEEREGSK